MKIIRKNLFKDIWKLSGKLAILGTGVKKATFSKQYKTQKFWVRFFGFYSLSEMTTEELKNLKALIESEIRAVYKHKGLSRIKLYKIIPMRNLEVS